MDRLKPRWLSTQNKICQKKKRFIYLSPLKSLKPIERIYWEDPEFCIKRILIFKMSQLQLKSLTSVVCSSFILKIIRYIVIKWIKMKPNFTEEKQIKTNWSKKDYWIDIESIMHIKYIGIVLLINSSDLFYLKILLTNRMNRNS